MYADFWPLTVPFKGSSTARKGVGTAPDFSLQLNYCNILVQMLHNVKTDSGQPLVDDICIANPMKARLEMLWRRAHERLRVNRKLVRSSHPRVGASMYIYVKAQQLALCVCLS